MTKVQVSRTLMLPLGAVNKMISQGILQPVTPEGEKQLFHVSDISEVLSVIQDRVHLSKIWNRVLVAYNRSARNERRIDELMELLGAKERQLPVEQWAVEKLYARITKYLKKDLTVLSADTVLDWCKTFLAMDMYYLKIAAHFLRTKEPWYLPLLLGQKMLEQAPRELFSERKDLAAVYGYLTYAMRGFREQAYFYCRTLTGSEKTSGRKFPDRDTTVSREIARLVALSIPEHVPEELNSLKPSQRNKKATRELH